MLNLIILLNIETQQQQTMNHLTNVHIVTKWSTNNNIRNKIDVYYISVNDYHHDNNVVSLVTNYHND
ncbi:unnamed protein product [Schistosoma rodhaini]|uniref:Uncharacterized protein n=1 Tax=Schistosoma rodhaini TaxID=6188 RepID=A0AA85FDP3_9TREM|nr:unnamed protein product [Schistosoma rodhaini]CAH8531944.1 unnamed protein product [Schistosoma rodhaini]